MYLNHWNKHLTLQNGQLDVGPEDDREQLGADDEQEMIFSS